MLNSDLSTATETLGNTLFICYSDSLYENLMLKIRENLKTNQDLAQRNIAIGANLQRVVNVIVDTHKQLKLFAAQREECRIYYDHYRLKIQDLEAQARKQPDQGRDASSPLNAKLYRNQAKFATAKQNFEGANRRADEMIQ